jgi:hypothetical protein
MKKLRANMDSYFKKLDGRWQALPVGKQHKYTLCFFIGYLLLTAGVILKVWSDAGKADSSLDIEHIENPVLKKKVNPKKLQDTLTTIFKNKFYERK